MCYVMSARGYLGSLFILDNFGGNYYIINWLVTGTPPIRFKYSDSNWPSSDYEKWEEFSKYRTRRKEIWCYYNDFSETPQFWPVRNQCTWKTFWFIEIIWNYSKWRFSEKEYARVLINMEAQVLLFTWYTFIFPPFPPQSLHSLLKLWLWK